MTEVDATLKRETAAGALVDWLLTDDTDNTSTGLSDPTVDFGARARLTAILAQLGTASTEATQLNRYGGGKTAAGVKVTTAGETVIAHPSAGKRIRLFWIEAIPKTAAEPELSVYLGPPGGTRVQAYPFVLQLAHWEVFTGPVDGDLIINLDVPATVLVTAHYTEV